MSVPALSALIGATLISALVPGVASATPSIASNGEPPKPKERRNEVNIGLLAGGTDIGQDKRYTLGVQVEAGRRFGDLVLLGEYNYLSLGRASNDNRGSMSRLGVIARYSLLRTSSLPNKYGKRSPVSGDYWLELGAGMERVAWDRGGVLHRPDVIAGFGLQFNSVIGRKSPKPKYFGPYVALRAHVARAPESTLAIPPTCSGPCDSATSPPGTDISLFLHAGINWGR